MLGTVVRWGNTGFPGSPITSKCQGTPYDEAYPKPFPLGMSRLPPFFLGLSRLGDQRLLFIFLQSWQSRLLLARLSCCCLPEEIREPSCTWTTKNLREANRCLKDTFGQANDSGAFSWTHTQLTESSWNDRQGPTCTHWPRWSWTWRCLPSARIFVSTHYRIFQLLK